MKPTQADYDRIANWIDASYEVAIMFKGGMSRSDILQILGRGYPHEVDVFVLLDFIDNSIRLWMLEESGLWM